MNLDLLLEEPINSLNYVENFINFPKYFGHRIKDDISDYNSILCIDTKIAIVEKNIKKITIREQNLPNLFFLNSFEKEINYSNLKLREITAKRTSSPRTFLVPSLDLYVKTHFGGRISSVSRIIDEDLILKTINSSELIYNNIKDNKDVSFFPEFGGVIWNNIGCIYRDRKEFPAFLGSLLPLHSLFGIDYNKPEDLPLFVQIAKRKRINPENFAVYEVIKPLLDSWKWFTFKKKQRITCHGQNILYGISSDFKERRIVHRDIQNERYDGDINNDLRLKISRDYDFIIGYLLLDRIKETHSKYINENSFIEKVKKIFEGLYINDFMSKMRVYEKGVGKEKKIVETNLIPKYR